MWKTDRILKTILILIAIPMITIWLPLVRGLMDGPTYEWGGRYWGVLFRGSGTDGDYWILPFLAAFSITLLYLGWRGARLPFHWLLLLWTVPFAFEATFYAVSYPERYRFRGDTLGVDVSLAWVGPLFWGGLALLSILWVVRDLRRGESRPAPEWATINRLLLGISLLLVPVQFGLLRFGEPHGATDKVGVILTMFQWALVSLSFVPWRRGLKRQIESIGKETVGNTRQSLT